MLLGDFSIICFEFLGDFWRKSQKYAKKKGKWKSGQNGPLRRSEGHPCRSEAEGPKRPPLGFAKA